MTNNYGECPVCGDEGESRERRPNGYTVCVNGHKTKSSTWINQAMTPEHSNNKEQVKPCPFCGSDDLRVHNSYVECLGCAVAGPDGLDHAASIRAWSNRIDGHGPQAAGQPESDFIDDVLGMLWANADIDGMDIQDCAQRHGIIEPVEMKEPCSEGCNCSDFYEGEPFICYRRAKPPTPPEQTSDQP